MLRETGSASGIFQLNRDVTRALALLLEGRLEEALTASSRALELGRRQLRLGTIVAQSYVTAFALWASGRHEDLQRHLGTVLALESVPLLQEPYLAGLLNFAILDAASHEHFTYAHALEHQHRALSRRAGPYPGMNVSVGVDDGGATAGLLGSWWARLAPAIEPGTVIQDAVLAFWTALSGGIDFSDRAPDDLDELARPIQLMWSANRLLRDEEPRGLLEVAQEFARHDFHLHTALLRVQAAVMFHREGDPAWAADAANLAWEGAANTQLDHHSLFGPLVVQVDPDGTGAGDRGADQRGAQQRGDRPRADPERPHRREPRPERVPQDRRQRPRPAGAGTAHLAARRRTGGVTAALRHPALDRGGSARDGVRTSRAEPRRRSAPRARGPGRTRPRVAVRRHREPAGSALTVGAPPAGRYTRSGGCGGAHDRGRRWRPQGRSRPTVRQRARCGVPDSGHTRPNRTARYRRSGGSAPRGLVRPLCPRSGRAPRRSPPWPGGGAVDHCDGIVERPYPGKHA